MLTLKAALKLQRWKLQKKKLQKKEIPSKIKYDPIICLRDEAKFNRS